MWYLVFKNGLEFPLLVNKLYNIGRKDTDIVISDDSSVSRKHGTIKVCKSNDDFVVVVCDTSKFGTYYAQNSSLESSDTTNFIKINASVQLINGNLIRIGAQHTVCKLVHKPFIVVTSRMSQENEVSLQTVLLDLDGTQVNSWKSNVTHLCTNELVLNIKVTQALANACWIVKKTFFSDFCNAIVTKTEFPLEKNYLPPLAEEGINVNLKSFLPNPSRKSLFTKRMFVFFSRKKLKRLGLTCDAAGATIKLFSDFDSDELDEQILLKTAVFIEEDISELLLVSKEKHAKLQQKFKKLGLRFIQEHEIGLALLYCSTDVYANPSFDLTTENMFTQHTPSLESFSHTFSDESHRSKFISKVPETELFDDEVPVSSNVSKKRLHEDIDVANIDSQETPSKTIKLNKIDISEEINYLSNIGSSKKKAKPPPKRKTSSSCAESQQVSKRFCCKLSKNEAVLNADDAIEEEMLKTFKKELPTSYITDDSLWSNKADSQEQVLKDVAIKVEKPDVLLNVNKLKDDANTLNVSTEKKYSLQENIVSKKAFIPASVPDDETSSDLSKFDPDLPFSGLSIVLNVSLVKKKPYFCNNISSLQSKPSTTKNYKKFVKVVPSYKNVAPLNSNVYSDVPHIIGGKDLISHINRVEKAAEILDNFVVKKDNYSFVESDDDNPFA